MPICTPASCCPKSYTTFPAAETQGLRSLSNADRAGQQERANYTVLSYGLTTHPSLTVSIRSDDSFHQNEISIWPTLGGSLHNSICLLAAIVELESFAWLNCDARCVLLDGGRAQIVRLLAKRRQFIPRGGRH